MHYKSHEDGVNGPLSGKDYTYMRQTKWNARRKLFVSLAVLGIVLVIAAIAQFTGKGQRESPYATASPEPAGRTAGGRAVFGADPRPDARTDERTEARSQAQSDPRPDPTGVSPIARGPQTEAGAETSTRARSERSDTTGINEFLTRWSNTVERGDVEGQTELYAPRLDRFFRQRNVSNASVRKVKSQMMSLYPTVNRYDISDVKVESNDGRQAIVSFRKEWDMNGQKRFAGAERQRLKLRRIDGDWKIVSEEETKVYWVKRG